MLRRVSFPAPSLVRMYTAVSDRERRHLEIQELDLGPGHLDEPRSVELPVDSNSYGSSLLAGETRLLVRDWMKDELSFMLYDLASGESSTVFKTHDKRCRGPRLLADGGFVIAAAEGSSTVLHVYDERGQERRSIDLGTAGQASFGTEPAPGRLALSVGESDPRLLLVDLETGNVREAATGLMPLWNWTPYLRVASDVPPPGSVASHLYRTPDGKLVWFDAESGERRTLLPLGP